MFLSYFMSLEKNNELITQKKFNKISNKTFCVGGSFKSYTSLQNLSNICEKITGNKIKFSKQNKTSINLLSSYILFRF